MKKRVQEMEAEAERLKDFHEKNAQMDQDPSAEEGSDAVDSRSVYVGNVRHSPPLDEANYVDAHSFTVRRTGRLRQHGRRDPGSLCPVRSYQPHNDPL